MAKWALMSPHVGEEHYIYQVIDYDPRNEVLFKPCPDEAKQDDVIYEGVFYPAPLFVDYRSFDPETKNWARSDELEKQWLQHVKNSAIAAVDAKTVSIILAGFDYLVPAGTTAEIDGEQSDMGGQNFHFNFDKDDQSNFTDGVLACTLAIQGGNAAFRRKWRGWQDDKPFVLSFTAAAFIDLATFAKQDHTGGTLESGWPITDAIRAATTVEEVEAIVDERA